MNKLLERSTISLPKGVGDMTTHCSDQDTKALNSVLIADDHEFLRQWMSDELTTVFPSLQWVATASTAKEAITKAIKDKPQIVFMDIDFQSDRSINGIDAAEKIWADCPQTAIIVVSNHSSEIYLRHLYRITPADTSYGFILKEKIAQHLKAAVNAVFSGDCWVDPDVMRIVSKLGNKTTTLTDNEYEALICIALGFTDETASKLLCLTDKAVQARLRSLYSKFGIPPKGDPNAGVYSPRSRAVWIALQRGLINEAELRSWNDELLARSKELGLALS